MIAQENSLASSDSSPSLCSAVARLRDYFKDLPHLEFMPHGYKFPIALPVITKGSRDEAKAWSWNGSLEKPTLRPSIKTTHSDGTISHIWLNDGMCQYLDDSTDGFAGQTLPLIPLPNSVINKPGSD